MINPAVISLASLQKFKNLDFPFRFEIEDNIGEAIHVHFKDIRIDLTVREFEELACECEKILENLIDCGDFKFRDFDPMLLTAISGDLSRIERIERREVFLEEILVDTLMKTVTKFLLRFMNPGSSRHCRGRILRMRNTFSSIICLHLQTVKFPTGRGFHSILRR